MTNKVKSPPRIITFQEGRPSHHCMLPSPLCVLFYMVHIDLYFYTFTNMPSKGCSGLFTIFKSYSYPPYLPGSCRVNLWENSWHQGWPKFPGDQKFWTWPHTSPSQLMAFWLYTLRDPGNHLPDRTTIHAENKMTLLGESYFWYNWVFLGH